MQEEKEINSLQTVCMDLESELLEEQTKDDESIKDTLNECKNEEGNIGSELDDFATVNTSLTSLFISFSCHA